MENAKRLVLMVTVVDRGKGERVAARLVKEGVLFSIAMPGRGTARKRHHAYFGVGEAGKDVLLSAVPGEKAARVMREIPGQLGLDRPGKGIMFSLPVLRAGQVARPEGVTMSKGGMKMNDFEHTMLLIILNHGYADDVMGTALAAGAPGGTVLRGHGAGVEQAERFLGITIQPEKDVLMIVAQAETGSAIMEAVLRTHGGTNEAHAVAFSLPICQMAGLSQA